MSKIQLPDGAIHGDDMLAPLQDLLRGLNVLPALNEKGEAVEASLWGTPQSVAVLEAGAPLVTKAGAAIATLLGAAGITVAGVGAFWTGLDVSVQRTLVTSMAIVAGLAIIAITTIVLLEVRMRLRGSLAIYDFRQSVAMAFLDKAVDASSAKIADDRSAPGAAEVSKTAHCALIVALAAARSQIDVRSGDTNGRLVGVVEDAGEVKVKFQAVGDQAQAWKAPQDVRLLQLNY